jgi:hypothetical protein
MLKPRDRRRPGVKVLMKSADNPAMTNEPTDADLLTALINAFGYTPDTSMEKRHRPAIQ